jgi:MOSC domain-containing protein YiiM
MNDPQWVKKFHKAERPGLYCRVLREGIVKTGDPVTVEKYTGETISLVQMYRDYYVKDLREKILRQYINSPIDIRSRTHLAGELEKLLAK